MRIAAWLEFRAGSLQREKLTDTYGEFVERFETWLRHTVGNSCAILLSAWRGAQSQRSRSRRPARVLVDPGHGGTHRPGPEPKGLVVKEQLQKSRKIRIEATARGVTARTSSTRVGRDHSTRQYPRTLNAESHSSSRWPSRTAGLPATPPRATPATARSAQSPIDAIFSPVIRVE